MSRHALCSAAVVVGTAVLLTGCSGQEEPDNEDLPVFTSLDEAYGAVDESLGCEAEPAGQPLVVVGDAQLTSEQRLCAEYVQVDMYPDEDYLQRGLDIITDSHQGEVHLVHGENWMVLDITGVATDGPTRWDLEQLAQDLGGAYIVTGTG